MTRTSTTVSLLLAATLSAYVSVGSAADQPPTAGWTIVIPTAAKGSTDLLTRALAERLSVQLKAEVKVENLPGRSGTRAAARVAGSSPGERLLLMATPASHGIASGLYRTLPYSVDGDFAPIAMIGSAPYVVASRKELGLKSLEDLIDAARRTSLSYGSTGVGGQHHLVGELFKIRAGVPLTHVPYQGGKAALTAVLEGRSQAMFPAVILALPQVRAGTIDALAVTSAKRSKLLPDIPTVAESGLPGFEALSWYALVGAKGMAPVDVDRVGTAVATILAEPGFSSMLEKSGVDAGGVDRAGLPAFFRAQTDTWGGLVKDLGLNEEKQK